MKLFNNYKLLFFFLLIVNTIISVFLYSIFDSHSYKGPTRVFQNIYEVSVERNFEFSDLDLLTSKTCFSNCKYFEKNVGNIYFKILQDLANQTKYKRTFEYRQNCVSCRMVNGGLSIISMGCSVPRNG